MNFKNLSLKILKAESLDQSIYPSDIVIESVVINKIKTISSFTSGQRGWFSRAPKKGPSGWEYAFSIFFFIDEIYLSKTISGNYESVNIKHQVSFKQNYFDNNSLVSFEVNIDGQTQKTKKYKTNEIRDKIISGFSASFHTHPQFTHENKQSQFTFFSPQDISSLVYGRIPIQGLIAGSEIWLACKTNFSQIIPQNLLQEASRIELNSGFYEVESFVKSSLNSYGIVFYHGKVGGRLSRV